MSASITRRTVFFPILIGVLGCGGSQPAERIPVIAGSEEPGDELWRLDLGRALEYPPVWVENTWVAASTEGTIWRLDAGTGEKIWKEKLPSSPTGPPVICGDAVIVSTDTPAGEVIAYGVRDGKELWKWKRAITFCTGGDSLLVLTARGGGVLRLHPGTGEVIWEKSQKGAGWGPGTLVPESGMVVVPVRKDSLVALDLADGERVWAAGVGTWPRVAAAGDALFAATDDGTLLRLDLSSGEVRARAVLPAVSIGSPVIGPETVFVSLRDGAVLSLDARTLNTRWKRDLAAPLVSSALFFNDTVYQAGPEGTVHALDGVTGKPGPTFHHPEAVVSSPRARGNELAVGGVRGMLVVYRRGS